MNPYRNIVLQILENLKETNPDKYLIEKAKFDDIERQENLIHKAARIIREKTSIHWEMTPVTHQNDGPEEHEG